MRADVLVTGSFRGLCLVLEPAEKRPRNALLEIDARVFADYFIPEFFGNCFISLAQYIQPHSVVQEFHLQRLICRNAGRSV